MTSSSPDGLGRRLARIAKQLAELGKVQHPPMCVMCGPERRKDPRLPALIAAAQAEGRSIVRPWSETPDGELVDWSSPAYQRAEAARQDAEAIDERDLAGYVPASDEHRP